LLPRVEPFAAQRVATRMAHKGLDLRYRTEIRSGQRPEVRDTRVGRIHGGAATVELSDVRTREVDGIVVAAGRRPTVDGLGLDTVGLTDTKVTVADDLTVDGVDGQWLYAVGDLAGRAALTHMGKYQARVCGDVIAARAE